MPETKVPLKRFFEEVERRLSDFSVTQLRSILRGMAREVAPGDRQRFLDRLQPVAETEDAIEQAIRQEDLLAEIEDLTAEIRQTMDDAEDWNDRYGYHDHYWDDEDSLGPYEEYVGALAELFDRTEAVFDCGDMPLALAAYRKLFDILELEDDYGRGIRAEDLRDTDLAAARGRYLRALYETESPKDRPERLFEAMEDLKSLTWRGPVQLDDLIRVSSQPLPDRNVFLRDWIAFLRRQTGREADRWLREATRLAEGSQGLETLARRDGKKRPRAYLDWIAALRDEGQTAKAVAAIREALRTLPEALPLRAAIADHLAALAQARRDADLLQTARWEAFAASPSLARLLDLWEDTPPAQRTRKMRQAERHLEAYLKRDRRRAKRELELEDDALDDLDTIEDDALEPPAWVTASLLAHARLLGKDWSAAMAMAQKHPVLGWSDPDNPQRVVVPVGLALLHGDLTALPPNLAGVWKAMRDESGGFAYTITDDERKDAPRLDAAYRATLPQIRLKADEADALQSWCVDVGEKRALAIVEKLRRKSYDKAAQLVCACAEVLRGRGRAPQADALLDRLRTRFPRHRAFQEALRSALAKPSRASGA